MRFVLLTAANDLRRRLRDPASLALWLGIPIAIGLMIRVAFGGSGGGSGPKAQVMVADLDDSLLSGLLLGAMGQQQGQSLPFEAEAVELEEGRERIEDGDASALLVIPEGFAEALLNEDPCTLELVTNPAQRILPGMVEEALELLVEATFYVHRIFGGTLDDLMSEPPEGRHTLPSAEVARISVTINDLMERMGALLFPPAIELVIAEPPGEEETETTGFGALFFPSMLFMTLFFLAQGLSEDIWIEKSQGTLRRALTTPHRAAAFLGGKVLAAMVLIGFVGGVALFIAGLAFDIRVQNNALSMLWIAVTGGVLTSLMLLLQLFASSQRAANLLSNLVMMPLLMLGGSFFPFEAMPDWMASIGRMTPNGWALVQLKAIQAGDVDFSALLPALGGLIAVGGLVFLLSVHRVAGAFARS